MFAILNEIKKWYFYRLPKKYFLYLGLTLIAVSLFAILLGKLF